MSGDQNTVDQIEIKVVVNPENPKASKDEYISQSPEEIVDYNHPDLPVCKILVDIFGYQGAKLFKILLIIVSPYIAKIADSSHGNHNDDSDVGNKSVTTTATMFLYGVNDITASLEFSTALASQLVIINKRVMNQAYTLDNDQVQINQQQKADIEKGEAYRQCRILALGGFLVAIPLSYLLPAVSIHDHDCLKKVIDSTLFFIMPLLPSSLIRNDIRLLNVTDWKPIAMIISIAIDAVNLGLSLLLTQFFPQQALMNMALSAAIPLTIAIVATEGGLSHSSYFAGYNLLNFRSHGVLSEGRFTESFKTLLKNTAASELLSAVVVSSTAFLSLVMLERSGGWIALLAWLPMSRVLAILNSLENAGLKAMTDIVLGLVADSKEHLKAGNRVPAKTCAQQAVRASVISVTFITVETVSLYLVANFFIKGIDHSFINFEKYDEDETEQINMLMNSMHFYFHIQRTADLLHNVGKASLRCFGGTASTLIAEVLGGSAGLLLAAIMQWLFDDPSLTILAYSLGMLMTDTAIIYYLWQYASELFSGIQALASDHPDDIEMITDNQKAFEGDLGEDTKTNEKNEQCSFGKGISFCWRFSQMFTKNEAQKQEKQSQNVKFELLDLSSEEEGANEAENYTYLT